jgi:hypothetical protein
VSRSFCVSVWKRPSRLYLQILQSALGRNSELLRSRSSLGRYWLVAVGATRRRTSTGSPHAAGHVYGRAGVGHVLVIYI